MAPDKLAVPDPETSTRRPLRLIRLARWLVLGLILFSIGAVLLSIALFAASIPAATVNLDPNNNWTTEMTLAALDQLGWSTQSLAWFFAVRSWITALVYCALGLIVFHHKSDSWFGLYLAVTFSVLLTSTWALSPLVTGNAAPMLTSWYALTSTLTWQFLFILFYLFPDGRFVPAWTRWLLLAWLTVTLAGVFAPSLNAYLIPLFVGLVISAVASQIYRYVRVSDALQRQQTKWIAFMGGMLLLIIIPAFTLTVPPSTGPNLATSFLVSSFFSALGELWILCLPIAIAIAILRYRLWEIDIIIRRTLVYVPLTAIMAGIFAASIKLLQALFSPIPGQQSEVATVLTTVIVVAVFDPIKGWLQKIVDARFKEASNPEARWKAYGDQVRDFVQMNDALAIARRLLEEAVTVFDVNTGAVYLQKAGQMQLVHTQGTWQNTPEILIPLEHQGSQLGRLALGARRNSRTYGVHDRELLVENANAVATAIALAGFKTTPD